MENTNEHNKNIKTSKDNDKQDKNNEHLQICENTVKLHTSPLVSIQNLKSQEKTKNVKNNENERSIMAPSLNENKRTLFTEQQYDEKTENNSSVQEKINRYSELEMGRNTDRKIGKGNTFAAVHFSESKYKQLDNDNIESCKPSSVKSIHKEKLENILKNKIEDQLVMRLCPEMSYLSHDYRKNVRTGEYESLATNIEVSKGKAVPSQTENKVKDIVKMFEQLK